MLKSTALVPVPVGVGILIMPSEPQLVRFGVFEVDLRTEEIRKAGIRLRLGGQPFQLLQALLERPGELITREELRQRLWPDNTHVDYDLALKKAVNRLRDVLGDSADSPHFIETVPRYGYRFIGAIAPSPAPTSMLPESAHSALSTAAPIAPVAAIPPLAPPAGVMAPQTRWTIAAGVALIGVVAILFGLNIANFRGRIFAKSRPVTIHSIAVLPLLNLSSDPAQEYFSDGMTDELITELAKFNNLRVISHTSVERYKETKRSLPDIARELGVDAVVEGRVMRSGDRIRITAQLIDARSDQHIWAQSYERDLKDVLSMQAEVAHRIASQIGVSLGPGEQPPLLSVHGINPAAYEAFLKGNFYWNRLSCANFQKALVYYSDALAKEPSFAPAYAGMSDSYFNMADWACSPQEEAFARSKTAALKAVELEPTLSTPHTILGELAFTRDWDWEKADQYYRRAIELDRNDAGAHSSYAIFLAAMGKQEEAFGEIKTAHVLDPTSEQTNMLGAYLLYLAHQFDRGIEQATRTLELYPRSGATSYWLGQIYEQKGMGTQAGAAYLNTFGAVPNAEILARRVAFQRGGLRGYWRHQFDEPRGQSVTPECWQTLLYAHLGDTEHVLQHLEYGFQHHCDGLQFLATEPIYDKFRSEPRFQELLQRMNLPTISFTSEPGLGSGKLQTQ